MGKTLEPPALRADCPWCESAVLVNAYGNLRHHHLWNATAPCKGSGKPAPEPKEPSND